MSAESLPGRVAPARRRAAQFHPLLVAAVDRLTPDAVAVTFEVPAELADAYRFTPGQHVTLRMSVDGQDLRRSYSICSPATEKGRLRVAVKRVPGGVFSPCVNERLRPGQRVEVMTPTGRFGVAADPGIARHLAMIAAGSGITPILSILSTTLECEPRSRCTLVYGNRTAADVMFLEELEDLKDRYPDRFVLLHVLSREVRDSDLLTGRIDEAKLVAMMATLLPPEAVDEWFLCGPQGVVDGARRTLLRAGVARQQIHVELFHVDTTLDATAQARPGAAPLPEPSAAAGSPSAVAEATDTSTVTAVLGGRSSTFVVRRAEERILDALLRVRSDAPYACRGAVCGTCRARLAEGAVRMDQNYALEPEEQEAGFVLACQSRPVTETVVLDFDA